MAQPLETPEIIQATGDFHQHAGRWIDADRRCPLPGPQRDALERRSLRALVAQMNRQLGIQRQCSGNGQTWNDAAPLRRAVGGDDVGAMTDAADDRRPLPRLTARENAKWQIGKMQAGPKLFHCVVPAEAGTQRRSSFDSERRWVPAHTACGRDDA